MLTPTATESLPQGLGIPLQVIYLQQRFDMLKVRSVRLGKLVMYSFWSLHMYNLNFDILDFNKKRSSLKTVEKIILRHSLHWAQASKEKQRVKMTFKFGNWLAQKTENFEQIPWLKSAFVGMALPLKTLKMSQQKFTQVNYSGYLLHKAAPSAL
jgi:hypothetical protein